LVGKQWSSKLNLSSEIALASIVDQPVLSKTEI